MWLPLLLKGEYHTVQVTSQKTVVDIHHKLTLAHFPHLHKFQPFDHPIQYLFCSLISHVALFSLLYSLSLLRLSISQAYTFEMAIEPWLIW